MKKSDSPKSAKLVGQKRIEKSENSSSKCVSSKK
jgi:hypothetical protein